jgi:hypothetical protein
VNEPAEHRLCGEGKALCPTCAAGVLRGIAIALTSGEHCVGCLADRVVAVAEAVRIFNGLDPATGHVRRVP